jgi:ribose 5-phosphate isomerase B
MLEIYLASDHAGTSLRQQIAAHLTERGMMVHDLGPDEGEKVDYPDYAAKLAHHMKPVSDAYGVLVCGSGIGISIAANRFPWIRAALCHDVTTAILSRQHNDANVIALGERLIGSTTALACIDAFFDTEFEAGRHTARVDKLTVLPVKDIEGR